ncbi:MAG: RagB/SusD family nutrient uptake outer membrane protein [Bacteroidia bacterium]|nr:RagB/SusD family nutrient uptake outer membrane protein [Bacteroidia bacterium]
MLDSITAPALSWYEAQDDRFSEYAIKKTLMMPNASGVLTSVRTTSTTHSLTVGKYDLDNYLWPSTRKWEWVNPLPAQASSSDQYNSIPYLRLADTYLVLSEALFRQDKFDEAAVWINKVRERSHATSITGTNVTIDFILDERSRELVTEEHRRYALLRTGKLVERVQLYNDFAGPTIANAPLLFPIPQSVIDANTGRKMDQNLGYN